MGLYCNKVNAIRRLWSAVAVGSFTKINAPHGLVYITEGVVGAGRTREAKLKLADCDFINYQPLLTDHYENDRTLRLDFVVFVILS